MKHLSLAIKMNLVLVPLLAMGLIVSLMAWSSLHTNARELIEARQVKELAVNSLTLLLTEDDATKTMILDPANDSLSERKIRAYDANQAVFEKMALLSNSPELKAILSELKDIDDKELRPVDTLVLEALGSGKGEEAKQLYFRKYEPGRARYETLVRKLGDQAEALALAAAQRLNEKNAQSVRQICVALFIGIAAVGLVLVFVNRRVINRPLQRLTCAMGGFRKGDLSQRVALQTEDEFGRLGTDLDKMADGLAGLISQVKLSGARVQTSTTEIAATSQQQQATATEIATTTVKVSATAKEISATAKELVKTIQDVAGIAESTATVADNGRAGLSRMESTIANIMDASSSVNTRLSAIHEKTANINVVVTTISKVADQTNLLSLNAAIEAEKAGEYGRGFAVVATEIRRLADQTAIATQDIEQMVREMQSAVSAGLMGMDKFSDQVRSGVDVVRQVSGQLAEIIQRVQTLTPNFEAVSDGMQSQSLGAEQISEALAHLSEAAQQTAESLRESNAAIEELKGAAQSLHAGVSQFALQS